MSAAPFEPAATALATLARRDLIRASPDDTVAIAARRMHASGCSSVVVTEGDKAVGIWTAADALRLIPDDPEARCRRLASVGCLANGELGCQL